MENHTVKFADLFDYIEAAEHGATDCAMSKRQSRTLSASDYWDFNAGFDGALDLARTGWVEGRTRIEEMSHRFIEQVEGAHREAFEQPVFTRSLVGSGVNVGRFIAGVPDAMTTRKRVEMDAPVIDVLCNVSASAGISADTYMIRGAAVAALVDLLELSGRRVRVTTVLNTTSGDGAYTCYVTVKHPGDPLQVDALAFALAHPAYMRRLGFSLMEQAPKNVRREVHVGDGGTGYGTPTEVESSADLYMPSLLYTSEWREEDAPAWVEQQLVNMGVLPKKEED